MMIGSANCLPETGRDSKHLVYHKAEKLGARVSGAVLLLGIGGYLCCRLLAAWLRTRWARAAADPSPSGRPGPPRPPTAAATAVGFAASSDPADDRLGLQTHYFGPLNLNNEEPSLDTTNSNDRHDLLNYMNQDRVGRRRYMGRDRPQLRRRSAIDFSSKSGSSSGGTGGSSPYPHPHHSFSAFSRSRRDASFDSASSDISLSFDMPSFADQEPEAVARLDRLQEEIDRLKDSCRLMDDDLETVKCSRNLPGLAELMGPAVGGGGDHALLPPSNAARACFTGLYSLTCLNRSMSLDLSQEEDSFPSLEWDDDECAAPTTTDTTPSDTGSYPDPSQRPPLAVGSPRHISACALTTRYHDTALSKGCEEVEHGLKYQWVRGVLRDEHCAVRCALFQCLARGLTLPRGPDTLASLMGHKPAATWQFGSLCYSGTNVLHMMEICLRALDHASKMAVAENGGGGGGGERGRAVALLLNTDPMLDLQLVNALRLHMFAHAIRLGQTDRFAPVFAAQLGQPPSPIRRTDSMNNWIVDVADTTDREQMELTLLGSTLQATVRVVRPSAHATDRFVCDYPADQPCWPQLPMLALADGYFALSA